MHGYNHEDSPYDATQQYGLTKCADFNI